MKLRMLMSIAALTFFAAVTIPAAVTGDDRTEEHHHAKHHRYKLIDIGTFGGPESNVNPAVNAGPIISRCGTTVGASATSVPTSNHSHPFVCGGLDGSVPFVFHGFRWQDGIVTDLGALPPAADNCSEAQGVNGRGEIVLQSENGIMDPLTGIDEIRAVLWKDGKIKNLGTFGGNNSLANQINGGGQIAGAALNTVPDPFSIYYFLFLGASDGTETRAFLWENGHKQDLGTLGTGNDAVATFVNERGQVAGFSYTNSTPNATTGFPTMDPFLWTKDAGMIDIGTLGGVLGSPNGLNNRGQVIGTSSIAADSGACLDTINPNCHSFLWDDGKLIDLTAQSGGIIVAANAINHAGEIVGLECLPSGACDGYLWSKGRITDLGVLPGDCFSQAFAINSRSQVVGQSFACDGSVGRTFLWENGSMVDLNTLIPSNSNLQLVDAQAINDRGEIAGDGLPPGCTVDGQCGQSFVLIPCDEEHSDEEGCDDTAGAGAATSSSAPETQSSTRTKEASLTPREIMARMRARFGRNRRFGAWTQK